MIAAALSLSDERAVEDRRWRGSSEIFFPGTSQFLTIANSTMCRWGPGARPFRSDVPAVLYGTIDNRKDLSDKLGCSEVLSDSEIYFEAVRAWGDEADSRIIGTYAAVVFEGSADLRISRSPWKAPPLFWAQDSKRFIVSTTPRLIFAAGFPRSVAPGRYAEMLYWIEPAPEAYWFEGLQKCRQGTIVHLSPSGRRTLSWYDPQSLPAINLPSDEHYVEAVSELLAEAVTASLSPSKRPGILLGGGLDSSLVADEILRQLPHDEHLRSFTFTPHHDWRGSPPTGLFADDRPQVLSFAETRPRLETHFSDNTEHGFDSLMNEFVLATGIFRPSAMISSVFDGPAILARNAGCDWLFDAGLGNNTFSNDGRWAYVEFLKSGKLVELWAMLRDQPGDERTMVRRFLARSLLMLMPESVRHAIRKSIHGKPPSQSRQFSLLRDTAIHQHGLDDLARKRGDYRTGEWFRSREQWLEHVWHNCDHAPEMHTASEEVYGLRLRDVTAYRPLIEFCAGIPTDQFVRGGTQRWLARRMAQERLSEAHRLNRNYGMHHPDWHLRMSRQLPNIREELVAIQADNELYSLIDVERGLETIDRWADDETHDLETVMSHFHALTGAVLTARYKKLIEGRNDF